MSREEINVVQIAQDLYHVAVPNHVGPSGQATNVYIVGPSPATLIDAGADDGGVTVMQALNRLGVTAVKDVVLTHAHQDHAGSAPAIQRMTGARVRLHPRDLGSSSRWNTALEVDHLLSDGEVIAAGQYCFQVFETPGHAPGHISLYERAIKALFAGDLLSGNGTIAIVPPLGSMREYLASLRRMNELEIAVIYPGHGPAIPNGNERIAQYIAHRERREEEIRALIAGGLETVDVITDRLYPNVLPRLRRQAAGTVLAHVIHLVEQDRVRVAGGEASLADSRFAAVN